MPPHLQPNANSKEYLPGTDQSRIYRCSHSEFSCLHPREIQTILREQLILVHGVPIDYKYGWDLESMDRLYDVDKKMQVHGKVAIHFVKRLSLKCSSVLSKVHHHHPERRLHQGSLQELHNLTQTFSNDECPPLNTISLPAYRRNLHIPPQFGSLASHEVAQSRLPERYEDKFEVPDVAVVVLEGSKYWIVATQFRG